MNIQNFEYLRDQLFYCGFGHKLEDALKSKMAKDKQEFQLQYRGQIDSEPVRAELHFSKSRQTDKYFFNSFRVELPQNSARVTGSRRFQVKVGSQGADQCPGGAVPGMVPTGWQDLGYPWQP